MARIPALELYGWVSHAQETGAAWLGALPSYLGCEILCVMAQLLEALLAAKAWHPTEGPLHAGSCLHIASKLQSRAPLFNTLGWCCRVTAIRVTPQLNAQAALTAPGASQAAPSSLLLQGSLPGDASQLSALQVMEIAGQR